MLVALVITGVTGAGAHAQTGTTSGSPPGERAPDGSVASLQAEAASVSHDYFAALDRARALDGEIAGDERTITTLEANAQAARAAATARAVAAYQQSSTRLSAIVDSGDAMAASRRARLIDEVNRRDHESYARLKQASADLREQRKELDARRAEEATAVADLQEQAAAADAKLAAAQQAAAEQAAQQVAAAATRQAIAAAVTTPSTSTSIGASPGSGGTTVTAAVQTGSPPSPPSKPVAPVGYTGTPGTNPDHDDPTLTCIRTRESSGNYGVVSRDGYLGAYQFAQSTWNIAAAMSGRADLVGVPANLASPYDQDAVAWALLQSQGLLPWGGHCP